MARPCILKLKQYLASAYSVQLEIVSRLLTSKCPYSLSMAAGYMIAGRCDSISGRVLRNKSMLKYYKLATSTYCSMQEFNRHIKAYLKQRLPVYSMHNIATNKLAN